jgi:hypothetical protein
LKLFDRAGKAVEVPDDQVQAALASGNYGAPAGTQIPVRMGGEIGSVPVENLTPALQGGAEVVSQKEYEDADLQARYGDVKHKAIAFGTEALDTATLGASNAVIGGIGGQGVRETIRKSQEANPVTTGLGTAAGIIAPVVADVATGGAATPAVAGALERAGEKAIVRGGEKALASAGEKALLGAGERAIPEATQVIEAATTAAPATPIVAPEAAGKGVIRQAVETSLLGPQRLVTGAGQAVEDAVTKIVGKEAETALGRIAQKTAAGAARGAIEGGAYGVGQEVGHQFLQDDPELNGERLASAWFNGALLGGTFGGGLSVVSQGSKEALNRVVGKEGISSYLSEKAGEHMWHAAGPTKKMTAEAERYAGGVAKVGNLIREDAQELLGKTPSSREELVELSGLMQTKHTGALDAVIDRLDSSGLKGERPKVGEILKDVDKVIAELQQRAAPTGQLESFKQRILDAVDARNPLTGEIDLNTRVPFRQLRNFRISLDEMIPYGAPVGSDSVPRVAAKELRNTFEERLMKITEPLANEAGGSLLKDYRAAKAGYQAGKLLEKAASSGVSAQKTNMFHSLTDKLLEIPGAMIGHAAAGPIGGLAVGLATGQASKFIRRNFDFVVSDALAKLADVSRGEHVLNAAQKSNERIQKRVDQGFASVRKGLEGKEVEVPITGGPQTFDERRERLLNVAAQHQAVEAHLQNVVSPLDRAAPNVASALKSASLRTVMYLMDSLPKPPPPAPNSLTPKLDEKSWEASQLDQAQFNRKYQMAVHPETALSLVAAGALTQQHVDALDATHPKMKADMQAKLRKELNIRTKPVPPQMRSSIRLFLGVPQVDPSLGKLMQSNYQLPPPSKSLSKPLKLDDHTTLNLPRY